MYFGAYVPRLGVEAFMPPLRGGGYSSSEKKYESMAYTFGTPDYRANGKAINGTGKPAMQLDKNTIVGYVPDVTSPYLQMEYMQDLLAKVGGG